MACEKCKAIAALRPKDSVLLRYPSRCDECEYKHEWAPIPEIPRRELCKLCHTIKKYSNENDRCPLK